VENSDDDILAFALKWRHWGGGSAEDILVEFGLSPADYFQRLQTRVEDVATEPLPPEIVHQLTSICRTRLPAIDHRNSDPA
jgi:hypothetical protein